MKVSQVDHASRYVVSGLLAALAVVGANAAEVQPRVLFTAPAEVPRNTLVPATSNTRITLFRGQPRIADDATWYALYSFPETQTAIEFTRDYVMLKQGVPYIREGLQLPAAPQFAPIADQAFSQQPFFDISIAVDGAVAQIVKGTDAFGLSGDGTPNPGDLDFPVAVRDLLVVDRAVVVAVGDELDVLPGVTFPRNALESLSVVKAANGAQLMLKADLDTGVGQFDPDTTVIAELINPGAPGAAASLRFTTQDTWSIPGLGFSLSSMNANEEDVDYNTAGSILLGVDIRGEPFNLDGAIVYYNALTGVYELIAREGDDSPLPGRQYDSLFNNPVALNDDGDIAFLASVNGSSTDDGLIVVNGAVVAREATTVGTAVPGPLQLGFANANIEMDAEGNIIYWGAWNAPKADVCPDNTDITSSFAIFEGIFFNDQVLIEAGVTTVHDVTIDGLQFPTLVVKDLPNTGFAGFHVSPSGRWLIVHALMAEPSADICAFSVNNDATPVGQVPLQVDLSKVGRPLGGIDDDQDVDADDWLLLAECLNGPAVVDPPAGCSAITFARADLDSDRDVDLASDVALLQTLFD